jgi:ABC-2 type transport system ATP-binding protein
MNMLELKNVTKCFGDFKALDDLSMTVPKGAVYGLVGPNGAGKSTAIRCLLGVYRPDRGEITLNGETIYENPQIKTTISSIPDDIFYFSSATLEDMRKFYRGIYPKFDDELFEKLYEVFNLPKKSPIRRFSKGMQKQAAFHLSICTRPDLLVLDEPVDGLDPVMRRQVWSLLLSDVAQNGTTVLISSHNLRELEDICDHVGIMDHGKMLLERSLADMQGSTHKVQIVGNLPEGLDILHESASGRLKTVIVRGDAGKLEEILTAANPDYFDILPLSLEEIFIYELGGVNYEVKSIVL